MTSSSFDATPVPIERTEVSPPSRSSTINSSRLGCEIAGSSPRRAFPTHARNSDGPPPGGGTTRKGRAGCFTRRGRTNRSVPERSPPRAHLRGGNPLHERSELTHGGRSVVCPIARAPPTPARSHLRTGALSPRRAALSDPPHLLGEQSDAPLAPRRFSAAERAPGRLVPVVFPPAGSAVVARRPRASRTHT